MPNYMIIETIQNIHGKYRLYEGSVSTHTKSAQKITKEWQHAIKSDKISVEVKVSPENNEKIDVIDIRTSTAYELKVSGKNTHHEFYKDLAKVITYNEYQDNKLKKLVFISEASGIESLKSRLDSRFIALIRRLHGLELNFIGI